MLPLVCNDALVVLFLFDLTNRSTLTSVREWYRQVRGLNKVRGVVERAARPPPHVHGRARTHHDPPARARQTAIPFLVGTKFDAFYTLERAVQEETTAQARKFAKAMKAPLVFVSASHGINVQVSCVLRGERCVRECTMSPRVCRKSSRSFLRRYST